MAETKEPSPPNPPITEEGTSLEGSSEKEFSEMDLKENNTNTDTADCSEEAQNGSLHSIPENTISADQGHNKEGEKQIGNDPNLKIRIEPECLDTEGNNVTPMEGGDMNPPVVPQRGTVLGQVSAACCSQLKAFFKWTHKEKQAMDVETTENVKTSKGKIIRTICAQLAYLAVVSDHAKIATLMIVPAVYSAVQNTLMTLNLGMIGPSMLDLEIQTGSTTQELSTIFTWRAALGLLASLIMGPVLDHVDRFFLLGFALAADVVFIAAAPWMTSLAPLLAMMAPPEFFNSVIGMGSHLICISIWKEGAGPSLQALNLMATIGYTLSPLLCKPFLAPSLETSHLSANQLNYTSNTSDTTEATPTETKIQFAYMIVAIYDLLIAVAVFSVFMYDGCNFRIKSEKKEEDGKDDQEGKVKGKAFMIKICVTFFIFNIFYGGIEVGYAGLLMTFAVKYLGWSKSDGTSVTAVLQASNAIVTASAVLVSRWVKAQLLLLYSIIVVTIAMIVLSFAVHWSYPVLWFCTACLGVGYATIMPCSYTWVNEVMEVTGKFSSAYWSGFFVGFMAIPAITGHLFEHVDPMWLPYMTLICSVGMFVMFIVISFIVYREKRNNQVNEIK